MRLVIFDVDGTLVDSQDLIVRAQGEAFARCGWPAPSRERSLSIVGLSLVEAFTALVGPDGPVEDLVAAYRDVFSALRADAANDEPLYPGAAATVARLAARPDIVLGIATGKARRGVAHLLVRQGWEGAFATVQTADDAPSKPHPGMLLRALAETGIGAERSLMVGDTTFDMAMARAAGIRAIGVAWGYHPVAALREAGAERVLPTLDALDALLPLPAEAA